MQDKRFDSTRSVWAQNQGQSKKRELLPEEEICYLKKKLILSMFVLLLRVSHGY